MNAFLMVNAPLFSAVTAYAVYLFVYLIRTRIAYIKLGQREEFDKRLKERLQKIWVNVFGQKKLLKDKKERHHPRSVFLRFYTRSVRRN